MALPSPRLTDLAISGRHADTLDLAAISAMALIVFAATGTLPSNGQ
jgi:hypothetical protein